MQGKYEPTKYLPPIGDLVREFTAWERPVIHDLDWVGISVFRGVLENA